jgi:hypothetical protein
MSKAISLAAMAAGLCLVSADAWAQSYKSYPVIQSCGTGYPANPNHSQCNTQIYVLSMSDSSVVLYSILDSSETNTVNGRLQTRRVIKLQCRSDLGASHKGDITDIINLPFENAAAAQQPLTHFVAFSNETGSLRYCFLPTTGSAQSTCLTALLPPQCSGEAWATAPVYDETK